MEKTPPGVEWARLRLDRQKTAIEFMLKRKELAAQSSKAWKEFLTNPLSLAIVGGFVSLMATIVTNHLSVSETLAVEDKKAQLNSQADIARANLSAAAEDKKAQLNSTATQEALQADLIKKFVEGPDRDTVRENLRFLVDAGFLPTYEKAIRAYLAANPNAAPRLGASAGTSSLPATGPAGLINETIAAVALLRLTPMARAGMTEVLSGTSLIEASTWYNQNPTRPDIRSSRVVGFVDVPRDATQVALNRDCRDGQCAIAEIDKYENILRNKPVPQGAAITKLDALQILVALVADIHRPLHVSYPDDQGGNRLRVTVANRAISLHALWDEMPAVHNPEEVNDFAQRLPSKLGPSEIARIESASPLEWAQEGLDITRKIYAELGDKRELDVEYVSKGLQVVDIQIAHAGIRLAKLLNDLFG